MSDVLNHTNKGVIIQGAELRGKLLEHEPLSRYTSWHVGGPARYLFKPADIEDLSLFLSMIPASQPIVWLGAGSNVLVREQGFDGVVILAHGVMNQIMQLSQNDPFIVRAECGVHSAQLARFVANAGLTGLEFLAGIPGTVGGALAMNAGAHGSSTWQYVTKVETINRKGERFERFPQEFQVGYRQVQSPGQEWFLAGHFALAAGDKNEALQTIQALLAKRRATQPLDLPNAGSVFRNPEGDYAARLIEAVGLKGYCINGACVSTKHANFIVNQSKANADDIERLIHHVETMVAKRFGIELKREIEII